MLASILGFFSTFSSAVGIIAFFTNSSTLLLICVSISLINSIVQVIWGQQNNLNTEIATVVIFFIISFFTKSPWYIIISFGLCLIEVIMWLLSLIGIIFLKRR